MELATAIAGAKASFDLLIGAVRAHDAGKIDAATVALRERLFAMSDVAMAYVEKNAALVSENAQLKLASAEDRQRYAELERKAAERDSYALYEVRPGAFVYALKEAVQGSTAPPPYLCQVCFDTGKKSVLNSFNSVTSGWELICPLHERHTISLPRPPIQRPD